VPPTADLPASFFWWLIPDGLIWSEQSVLALKANRDVSTNEMDIPLLGNDLW
jgi:hypothetical protein